MATTRFSAHEFLSGELDKYPQNIGSALLFPGTATKILSPGWFIRAFWV
ncbi:MAG: hypothetical protein GX900_06340 [Clostridiaceae bacterium]|nr:hypothetical protein [Clostridiaceae bacterium]